jgi:hypothetical protein
MRVGDGINDPLELVQVTLLQHHCSSRWKCQHCDSAHHGHEQNKKISVLEKREDEPVKPTVSCGATRPARCHAWLTWTRSDTIIS